MVFPPKLLQRLVGKAVKYRFLRQSHCFPPDFLVGQIFPKSEPVERKHLGGEVRVVKAKVQLMDTADFFDLADHASIQAGAVRSFYSQFPDLIPVNRVQVQLDPSASSGCRGAALEPVRTLAEIDPQT